MGRRQIKKTRTTRIRHLMNVLKAILPVWIAVEMFVHNHLTSDSDLIIGGSNNLATPTGLLARHRNYLSVGCQPCMYFLQ